ncbi:MAG TPA: AmpG family muropeptide MFS transporter [Alphaproteobacteria bacterium]|nr:AmpG family muropeptide MFS transporter [Alphaproteobacteria bacterium]
MMSDGAESKGRWRDALAVYGDRRMLCILLLGFSSGLPLALTGATLTAWLATAGVTKTQIGLFALVAVPYSFKFVWSPLIDGLRLPVLTKLLGRRRGWAVASQVALLAAILAMGSFSPAREPGIIAALAVLVAFLSATQDIVVDAYRVEILKTEEQGAGSAAVQAGYRIGMLVSGAGALYIAEYVSWFAAYAVMAALIGVGIVTILANPEPVPQDGGAPPMDRSRNLPEWIRDHIVMPFGDFLRRPGWAPIIAFIVLYKFGDAVAGVMANPFYIETGFTLGEIASISKLFGFLATLAGVAVGGIVVARYGVLRALLLCGVLQALTNLMFAAQAVIGHDLGFLTLTIASDNFTGGMGAGAFVAYISSLCSFSFTATQYALFSSLAVVGRTTLSSGGGWLADRVDWVTFFCVSAAAALPGLLLLAWMMRRGLTGLKPSGES